MLGCSTSVCVCVSGEQVTPTNEVAEKNGANGGSEAFGTSL
jgi:hypothetical protein